MRFSRYILILAATMLMASSCTISYKFNGTIIDYSKVKSISITDFTNHAAMVYAPLTNVINEQLKDKYSKLTRLNIVNNNGDLELDGEVTGYDITATDISSTSVSTTTRLTIRLNVRYTNNTDHEEDFERGYTAYREFDSSKMITDVQDELINQIIEEIVDKIYNDTVANW